MLIDDAVEDLAGVNTSATNVGRKQTVVEFDPTKTTIREITAAIDAVGYRAVSA